MLLGLQADTVAAKYRDDSTARGGPMMLLASPTLPPPGLNPACAAYGASVLILPEASLDSVHVNASLCTQGEINARAAVRDGLDRRHPRRGVDACE